ncbi:MAG: gliding motility-associated C-terminal domain-containing protein [Saprospiraceae bacterium]
MAKSTLLLLCALFCLSAFDQPLPQNEFACDIYVPNAFSPNDDGVNDLFQAHVGCTVTAFDFRVFNRWGQMVYSTVNQEDGWDGTLKGEPMLSAVYVYVLQISYEQEGEVKSEVKTGDVALIR